MATPGHLLAVSNAIPMVAVDHSNQHALSQKAPVRHDARMETVVILNQDQMGHGDRALSQKILGTFLKKSISLTGLSAIVMWNSGVKLVGSESPVLAELKLLEERGVDLLPCGTCLAHYGITPLVGTVSDMDKIMAELGRAAKVITL